MMPTLPIEIVYSVVDELVNDNNTLLVLLLVCHDLNRQALRILYNDLSFDLTASPESLVALKQLSRVIENNQGIQHTKGFAISLPDSHLPAYRQAYNYLEDVIPALVNLRSLSIRCDIGDIITPTTLRLVSSRAQLTHLYLDCMLDSDDFISFLNDHPSLQCLIVFAFMDDGGNTLSIPTLPNLRSLVIPADISLFPRFGNKPSLADLTLVANEFPCQTINAKPIADAFATIRTLSTACIDFSSISALVPLLPNLEYLSTSGCPPSRDQYFTGLTSTKLKYAQFDFNSDPLFFAGVLFAGVQTLLIVDFRIDVRMKRCRRVYRNSSDKIVHVNVVTGMWQQWWESAEKDLRGQIGL